MYLRMWTLWLIITIGMGNQSAQGIHMLNTQSMNKAVFASLLMTFIWVGVASVNSYFGNMVVSHLAAPLQSAPQILEISYMNAARIFLVLLVITAGYSWLLSARNELTQLQFLLTCWIALPFLMGVLPGILINDGEWYHSSYGLVAFLSAVYALKRDSSSDGVGLELLWWMAALLYLVREYVTYSDGFYLSQGMDYSLILILPVVVAIGLNILVFVFFPRWFLASYMDIEEKN